MPALRSPCPLHPQMSSVAQTATNLDPIEFPYQAIGDAIGRKVKRYWDKDGAALKRNKGNPWCVCGGVLRHA